MYGFSTHWAQTSSSERAFMCLRRCRPTMRRVGSPGRPISAEGGPNAASKRAKSIRPASCTSGCRASMMASSRGRDRSSPWDGRGFGRIGCLLHQAEEHAIMNRAETEDGSYASGRNRKLLAEWAAKAGENEYAEPALNPCQTTAYAFFTGDQIAHIDPKPRANPGSDRNHNHRVVHRRREPEASHNIGRAVQANKAGVEPITKQRLGRGQIVDEHHRAPAIPAEVKAQRRPLPVDPALARVAGEEHAFPIAQATKDRGRVLLAHDVAVGLPPAPDGFLDRQREPF